jgi:hypothetical protein
LGDKTKVEADQKEKRPKQGIGGQAGLGTVVGRSGRAGVVVVLGRKPGFENWEAGLGVEKRVARRMSSVEAHYARPDRVRLMQVSRCDAEEGGEFVLFLAVELK